MKAGDQTTAYQYFGQAFFLDPTNRQAFTAYERLCYRREQWTEALRIYETALKLIETQKSRSYRPADLYLRRGQVQLQYLQLVDEAAANYLRALESDAESDSTRRRWSASTPAATSGRSCSPRMSAAPSSCVMTASGWRSYAAAPRRHRQAARRR